MNRTEIIQILSRQKRVEQATVETVLQGFVDLVLLNLAVGEPVMIRGLGTFNQKKRPAVTLKHPRTGEPINTGDRVTISFRPSSTAKKTLNPDPFEMGPDPHNRGSVPSVATVESAGDTFLSTSSTDTCGAVWTTATD